jgi:Arc/MetJ family transcription regulator
MHMVMFSRTTINIRADLLRKAREATGIRRKTDLVHAGLEELIAREARHRIAAMAGSLAGARAPRRRRFVKRRP